MSTLFIYMYLMTANFLHVGHTAEYYFQLDGTHLNLKFIIEKEELMGFELNNNCDLQKMTALCAAEYLSQNSSITINGKIIGLTLEGSETENGHLIVYLNAEISDDAIHEIFIRNDCFLEFNRNFKNRVVIDIAEFQSSFLLKKNKNIVHLKSPKN